MRPVLAIIILATAAAAVLFLGSEAQEVKQDHHTERISGAGQFFFLVLFPSRFSSCLNPVMRLMYTSAKSKTSIA